jgi:hypothetical protein
MRYGCGVAGWRNISGDRRFTYGWLILGIAAFALWAVSSERNRAAPRPVATADAAAVAPPTAPSEPKPPAVYVPAPVVVSVPQPNGRFVTEVRFRKVDGPWAAGQSSKFDVWLDGDVEKEFESRGFSEPDFRVEQPEPRHFAIRIDSPPLDSATYVAFAFKSAKPVAVVRSDVSPALERAPADP